MPGSRTREYIIPEELDGVRLDRALAALVEDWSRERLRRVIEAGQVELGGVPVTRPSEMVAAGAALRVLLELEDEVRPGARAGLVFRVLYEDEALVAIDKPAGMVAHPSTTVRGGTVSELACARYGELPNAQGADRPGIVHRLDSETSGVMVLARTPVAAEHLIEQFRERRVRKIYHALAQGEARFDSDWIEYPLARSAEHEGRVQIATDGQGKPASTFYRTLERFDGAAFLELEPKTGRTHQLRAHLEAIDLPLFGDPLYRGRRRTALPREAPVPARQALHASRLELVHPDTGQPLCFEAPLPADLNALLDWLRRHRAPAAH
jgi:23S rRNA pseudouridine1911/1915/1917 synthase